MTQISCKRCGLCCHYLKDGVLKKCKYLVRLRNGTTLCRVFNTRLKRILDKVDDTFIICIMRQNSKFNYDGCPFNDIYSDKEMFPKDSVGKSLNTNKTNS